MDWLFLIFALISATLFGIAGLLIGEWRGARPVAGFWLGFFLGPLGVFCAGLADRQCPACRSWIAWDATRCVGCHGILEPTRPPEPEGPQRKEVEAAMARARELKSKP